MEREGDQEFSWLFVRPSRILFVWKEGLFAGPSSASLGRWVSARLQEEPPSLCMEREGDQEFPWLFVRPSRILFVRKEGLFARPSSVSLGRWVSARLQEEPRASARSERAIRSSPSFLCDPRASFLFRRRGCLPSPRVRAWVVGSRQGCRKSPRASTRSERAIRSSPGFLCDRRASFSFGRRGGISQATLGGRER
jgi:hypothetical protein